jgi:hypothetical protein
VLAGPAPSVPRLRLESRRSRRTLLLTVFCGSNSRVDLLIVPPGTAEADALAAMELAASAVNVIHAIGDPDGRR